MTETNPVADAPLTGDADAEVSNAVPVAGGPFRKGFDPRRNLAGRIKKAPTVLDETAQLAHQAKHRRRIARAWVETMAESGTAAGNRARADFSDRIYGLPKQTLVLEQGDSPLAGLLERLAARGAIAGPVVEGESRVIEASDAEAGNG